MARSYKQGQFIPRNPQKYRGDINNIVYRSSWEQSFCEFLDNNPNILSWASEEIAIPYVKPTDGKVHHYYPDFWIKYRNKNGEIIQELVEIKPSTQVEKPKRVGKRKQQQLHEDITYAVNIAKWKAANEFCKKSGIQFRILTEKQLFL